MQRNAHKKQSDDDVVVEMDEAAGRRMDKRRVVSILFYCPCRVCKLLPRSTSRHNLAHSVGRRRAGLALATGGFVGFTSDSMTAG